MGRVRAGLVVLVFAVAGCSSSNGLGSVPPTSVPSGFVAHDDLAGFSLQRPTDWQVAVSGPGQISVFDPAGGPVALIRARIVIGDLAQWLGETYLSTEAGVQSYESISVESQGRDVAQASLRFVDDSGAERLANVVAVRFGDMATVFAAIAPSEVFASSLPTMAQILDSFRFDPPGEGTPTANQMEFVQWVDPFEAAWSMDVPAGWATEGGMIRSADGVVPAYQITAPDGEAFFFGGDLNIPRFFVLPTDIARSLGFVEGQPTGPGGPIMIAFQDAATFGAGVIEQRFGQAQILDVRPRPDRIDALLRNPTVEGAVPLASAAEIEFQLADGRTGMLTLGTYGQMVGELGGTWFVDSPLGFIAPADRVSETAAALARAIGTTQENPEWRRAELAHQAQLTAQWQEYLDFSNNLQRETIEARWVSDEAIQEGRGDVLSNTVRLVDPQTGERFEASGYSRFYFRVSGEDTIVGADIDENPAPDLDLRELLVIGEDIPR